MEEKTPEMTGRKGLIKGLISDHITRPVWRACKFLFPILIFFYVARWLEEALEEFWAPRILNRFPLFLEGEYAWILRSAVSIFLTILVLVAIGYILTLKFVKRTLSFLTRRISLLSYFWSDEETEERHLALPVLFQYPMPGEWKLGFKMGEQKLDDGRTFHKIFFITGIGDHELIEVQRSDLMIPLDNPPTEILHLIASLMISGPRQLRQKQE